MTLNNHLGPHTAVPVGLGEWEPANEVGKRVDDVRVLYYETLHPQLEKRVVEVETVDGCVYRFQRFHEDERLSFYNRENEDGDEFRREARLPENVRALRDAISDGELTADKQARANAEQPEHQAVQVARADGGIDQAQDDESRVRDGGDDDDECGHPHTYRVGPEGSDERCGACGEVVRR